MEREALLCPKCTHPMRRLIDGKWWCLFCHIRSDGTTKEQVYNKHRKRRLRRVK